MPSWKLVAGWVVVVAATTLLAWQIVSLADSQVSATPVEILTPTTTTLPATTSSSTATSSTSTTASPTTSPTTPSPSTSSPGTSAAEWSVRTVNSAGGTVIIRHRTGEVELQAATPLPGFVMEIDDAGPDRVRVEFENDNQDVRVEIRWESGVLDVEVSD